MCKDLGFTKADRLENIRRLGEVANGFNDGIVIIAAINLYEAMRAELIAKFQAKTVYVKCDLATF